jgi:hypothetical protein
VGIRCLDGEACRMAQAEILLSVPKRLAVDRIDDEGRGDAQMVDHGLDQGVGVAGRGKFDDPVMLVIDVSISPRSGRTSGPRSRPPGS